MLMRRSTVLCVYGLLAGGVEVGHIYHTVLDPVLYMAGIILLLLLYICMMIIEDMMVLWVLFACLLPILRIDGYQSIRVCMYSICMGRGGCASPSLARYVSMQLRSTYKHTYLLTYLCTYILHVIMIQYILRKPRPSLYPNIHTIHTVQLQYIHGQE